MVELKKGRYRHYKGKMYEVLGVARDSETLKELILYKALYESDFGKNVLWVRPVEMFFGEVEVDGKKVARFSFVNE